MFGFAYCRPLHICCAARCGDASAVDTMTCSAQRCTVSARNTKTASVKHRQGTGKSYFRLSHTRRSPYGDTFRVKSYGLGTKYAGCFREDSTTWHGRGRLRHSDGYTYDGYWEDGLKHGTGTIVYASGDLYVGDWVQGKRHGRGEHYVKWVFVHLWWGSYV